MGGVVDHQLGVTLEHVHHLHSRIPHIFLGMTPNRQRNWNYIAKISPMSASGVGQS